MPQPRRYPSHAARQAAYHQRCELARRKQLEEKGLLALPALPNIPGYPRWRQAVEQARALLELVQTEMEDYADQRSDQWHETERADNFKEQLDAVIAVHDQLTELDL